MFFLPLAIGAGTGLLKNTLEANQAADERKRQAAITRYSPWTGMTGHTVKDPSLFGNIAQGAAAGGMIGQGLDKYNAEQSAAGAAATPSPNLSSFGGAPDASKFSLMNPSLNGSAGALGGAGASPWSLMPNGVDQNDPFGFMKNMYAQNS